MGILGDIKEEARNSGGNRQKILYIRSGEKKRIRFLTDMDDGMKIVFHNNWEERTLVPCQEIFGRDCPYCGDDSYKDKTFFVWSVYDYELEKVVLAMYAFNNFTPLPQLLSLYENFGTITDRDIVIVVSGKQLDKNYTCIHQDKTKFRNPNAKPYSNSAILKIIDKAYPCDGTPKDDEEEEEKKPKKTGTKKSGSKNLSMNPPEEDEGGEEENGYDGMSAVALYKECVKRNIECEKRKPEKYYIRLLEEDDKAEDDWGEEDEDGEEKDEWEEDDTEGLPFN